MVLPVKGSGGAIMRLLVAGRVLLAASDLGKSHGLHSLSAVPSCAGLNSLRLKISKNAVGRMQHHKSAEVGVRWPSSEVPSTLNQPSVILIAIQKRPKLKPSKILWIFMGSEEARLKLYPVYICAGEHTCQGHSLMLLSAAVHLSGPERPWLATGRPPRARHKDAAQQAVPARRQRHCASAGLAQGARGGRGAEAGGVKA